MSLFRSLLSISTTPYFTVYFNANGGSPTPPPQRVKMGAYCTNPGLPHLANHNTLGWYLNGSIFNFNTPIYSDITLVANYQYVPYSHGMDGVGVMNMWRYGSSGSVKRRYYRVNGTFPTAFVSVPTSIYVTHPDSGGSGYLDCSAFSIGNYSGGYLTTTAFEARVTASTLGVSALYEKYNGTAVHYTAVGYY